LFDYVEPMGGFIGKVGRNEQGNIKGEGNRAAVGKKRKREQRKDRNYGRGSEKDKGRR